MLYIFQLKVLKKSKNLNIYHREREQSNRLCNKDYVDCVTKRAGVRKERVEKDAAVALAHIREFLTKDSVATTRLPAKLNKVSKSGL